MENNTETPALSSKDDEYTTINGDEDTITLHQNLTGNLPHLDDITIDNNMDNTQNDMDTLKDTVVSDMPPP